MSTDHLTGVLVPALTPFLPDLSPNKQAFLRHCHWLLGQGADGLAVFGTTSEANSMSVDERTELLDALIESGIEAKKLMPGTGACALPDAIRLTRHAVDRGCAGVLMLPPFYYKGVGDDGLFDSFSRVIDEVGDDGLRVYLYHIPPMSQVPVSLQLLERLVARYPSIVVGLKDSGGDWEHTVSLLQNFPGLSIFPGSELFLLDGLRQGGAGCITATGNVNPAAIKRVFEHWRETEADELQAEISGVRKTIQSYPMIPALKFLLSEFCGDPDWARTRPPLSALEEPVGARLLNDLGRLGFTMVDTSLPGVEVSAGNR